MLLFFLGGGGVDICFLEIKKDRHHFPHFKSFSYESFKKEQVIHCSSGFVQAISDCHDSCRGFQKPDKTSVNILSRVLALMVYNKKRLVKREIIVDFIFGKNELGAVGQPLI